MATKLKARFVRFGQLKCKGAWRRGLDEDTVVGLVESMKEFGQLVPGIRVAGRLEAGYHRLEAAKRLELGGLWVVDAPAGASPADAEAMSIDENLRRRTLGMAERATLLERRRILYEQKYPEAGKGGRPEKVEKGEEPAPKKRAGFARETAQATGRGVAAVRRDLRLASEFSPAELKRMEDAGVTQQAMLRASKVPPKFRPSAIETAIENARKAAKEAPAAGAERSDVQHPSLRVLLFEIRPTIERAGRSFDKMRSELAQAGERSKALIAERPKDAFTIRMLDRLTVAMGAIAAHVAEIAPLFGTATPHAVCPYCKLYPAALAKCAGCKGTGYVTAAEYDAAPDALRVVGAGAGIYWPSAGEFKLMSDLLAA